METYKSGIIDILNDQLIDKNKIIKLFNLNNSTQLLNDRNINLNIYNIIYELIIDVYEKFYTYNKIYYNNNISHKKYLAYAILYLK